VLTRSTVNGSFLMKQQMLIYMKKKMKILWIAWNFLNGFSVDFNFVFWAKESKMTVMLEERHFSVCPIIVKVLRLWLTEHKLSWSIGVKIVGMWGFDIIHFIPCSTWQNYLWYKCMHRIKKSCKLFKIMLLTSVYAFNYYFFIQSMSHNLVTWINDQITTVLVLHSSIDPSI